MNTIITTLTTEAIFSDDHSKRYLLRKIWDKTLPKLTIIMLAPSDASGIAMDTTTQLVLNNASRLGYGTVSIVNLFATLNDFSLKQAEDEDPDNLNAIMEAVQTADQIVYAAGTGKAKNKSFLKRQEQVLKALMPMESKLKCLCNEAGKARLLHPLAPAVRIWHLSPLKVSELVDIKPQSPPQTEQKSKGKPAKKANKSE